ncbi:MAG TPA: D-alanyl-D-alanine carboxypeptidase/D-alanyl-D-alanine-endopeptidase [Longimicrobiales bacterium]|nr:D-alanyl-D-alanine carboxypeptidase/D-alanyl-D-alanine-endopeptidase [Longimicrobiales bacterium]
MRTADSILVTPPLDRGHIGIEVYDPATGRILYGHDNERRFVPASNQKLWPTTTALHELGPDFRYRTPVLGVGFDATTGAARALVAVGRGDPTWSERFYPPDPVVLDAQGDTVAVPRDPERSYRRDLAVLDSLADSVAAAGVTHITGDLIIDATYFDGELVPGTWTFGNMNGTSAPPTGAFVVGEGVFRVRLAPGVAVGSDATVVPMAPAGVVPLLNGVITTAEGSPDRVTDRRGPWSDTLRLGGSTALGSDPETLRFPMTDPVRFAADAFAQALRARGVTIDGTVRVVHDSVEAEALRRGVLPGLTSPLPAREVATWTSPPLSEIVHNILAPSQNWIAEQLLRTLGAERGERGGWREGIAVETDFLFDTVGIDPAALRLQDGSGMSHQNLVTPHAVVQLLDYARTASWGPVFRDALATPGMRGTLERRLPRLVGRLSGKTGTLSSVNALSGYVRTQDGRELIFSILSNASGLGSGPVVAAIDRMVDALANGIVPR